MAATHTDHQLHQQQLGSPEHKTAQQKNGHGNGIGAAQLIVGCALLPKKVQRYLTPRMLQTAAANNIVLRQIDSTQPLAPQGPFDVIIHKLRPNPDWEQQLRQYAADNPRVVVVDSLDRIRQLHNRATMLRPLQGDGIVLQQPTPQQQQQAGSQQQPQLQQPQVVQVQAPLQVEIGEGTTEAEAQAALTAAGLTPPLLCKPLWTDGRDGSHTLAVLHDLEALGRLLRGQVCSEFKPPLVVQQFVEHGGVLFKVYVLGAQTYVTARPSLGETVMDPAHAVQQLPRISCVSVFSKQQQHMAHMQQPQAAHSSAAGAGAGAVGVVTATPQNEGQPVPLSSSPPSQHHNHQQQQQHQQQPSSSSWSAAAAAVTCPVAAESVWRPPTSSTTAAPPAWLTSALAATLRQELGMQLFNFDLLVPEQQPVSPNGRAGGGGAPAQGTQAPALCYVVDVNYFPGVDKLPDFEQRFVQFLLAAAASSGGGGGGKEVQQTGAATAAAVRAAQPVPAAAKDAVVVAGSSSHNTSRRNSSSGGGGGASNSNRRLQHSLSAGHATAASPAGGGHSRRHSGTGGSGSSHSGSSRRGSSGLDVPPTTQWGDRAAALGSSPPPQLQVAGCS